MTDLATTDLDTVKDIAVDASDLKELKQSFDACDSNSDGWIVNREFSALLRSLDQDMSDDECLLAFELTDSDGDGSISFEEFMDWWAQ
ncbi:MAG: EF-hand domain-containing protein [Pseudomonadota bacterium]|nr:EF-hand domain-containing protein [Pseudomonadota bacterium]